MGDSDCDITDFKGFVVQLLLFLCAMTALMCKIINHKELNIR